MKIPPVSFGSLLIFTIKDGRPKLPIDQFIRLSFENNPKLQKYNLKDELIIANDIVDGTVHNATNKFAKKLDVRYKDELRKDKSKVILTKAQFYVNPTDQEDRFFLTAGTQKEENNLLNAFECNTDYFAASFSKSGKS